VSAAAPAAPAGRAEAGSASGRIGPFIEDRSWFDRPALTLAPALLGSWLVHDTAHGRIAGRIVETEAYTGPEDLAAHSARGRTPRNAVMFGDPGHLYVYLIYGIHHCLNVVSGPGTKPEAVLIRAVAVAVGVELARQRRGAGIPAKRLAAGPGNVAAAFGVDRRLNGHDLLAPPVRVAHGEAPAAISMRPRVGVPYASSWADLPYRFLIADDPHRSRP
jgi:DNA-3-methyladenine glycosylase